jgi:hypothetical protein
LLIEKEQKMKKQNFKNFVKNLLLAQLASDSGKGYFSCAHNGKNAQERGYGMKDEYIKQSIAYSKRLNNVFVSISEDFDMTVVIFDVKGYGQVSFHTFADLSYVKSAKRKWNGIRGGSLKTCKTIAKKMNLQYYA